MTNILTGQQAQTVAPPTLPQSGYPIGTILHGTNPMRKNLWIVTVDNSYQGSLLYNGANQSICIDENEKRDRMSPGMKIADMNDVTALIGGHNKLPAWALNFILTTNTKPGILPKPSTMLPPGAIQAVNKALGITQTTSKQLNNLGLTKSARPKLWRDDDTPGLYTSQDEIYRDCPARKEGYCNYEPYYGFTDTYEYCVHCDHKRNMRRS